MKTIALIFIICCVFGSHSFSQKVTTKFLLGTWININDTAYNDTMNFTDSAKVWLILTPKKEDEKNNLTPLQINYNIDVLKDESVLCLTGYPERIYPICILLKTVNDSTIKSQLILDNRTPMKWDYTEPAKITGTMIRKREIAN